MNNYVFIIYFRLKLPQGFQCRFFHDISLQIENAAMGRTNYFFIRSRQPETFMRAAQIQGLVLMLVFYQQNIDSRGCCFSQLQG